MRLHEVYPTRGLEDSSQRKEEDTLIVLKQSRVDQSASFNIDDYV